MPTATRPKPETETPRVPLTSAPEPAATNVVEALARVMRDLPGIGKDQRAAQQQGGYAYRGIEDITRAVQPLLAREGVVFVPRVQSCEIREITVAQKPWTDTILTVEYRIYGPGDGDPVEATVVGIGRDNSDKGANKAMTQAYKYALLQVLCIADAKDDADAASYEADTADVPAERFSRVPTPLVASVQRNRIKELIEAADDPNAVKAAWVAAGLPKLVNLPVTALGLALETLTAAGIVVDELPQQTALVGCPHCGSEITAENTFQSWPDSTSDEDPPPMIAGCAACEPM